MAVSYWVMKSEADAYSIDDLMKEKRAMWDGVRNYQARNFMRDSMKIGDRVFFYHSNTKNPGIYGAMKICSKPYSDPTLFDKKSKYYDKRTKKSSPRWQLVDVCFVKKAKSPILLPTLREDKKLKDLTILRPGNRLSITPVSKKTGEYLWLLI